MHIILHEVKEINLIAHVPAEARSFPKSLKIEEPGPKQKQDLWQDRKVEVECCEQ